MTADDFRKLPRRAEKASAEQPGRSPQGGHDLQKLVHELRARQHELEMQNEALRGAEAALRESEAKYRLLSDMATECILWTAPTGEVRYASPACETVFDCEAEAAVADPRRLLAPIHPEDLPAFHEHRAFERANFHPGTLQFRVLRGDGEERWIEHYCEPMHDEAGAYVGRRSTNRDITQRKRAELELEDRRDQLQLLIDHAPVVIAMFDGDMHYLAASRRWKTDYGIDGRDIVGRSHYEIFPNIPERWRSAIRQALGGEVLQPAEDSLALDDGSIQWLRWEMWPWRKPDGAVGGIVVGTEDITARKQAERALAEREEQYRAVTETAADGFWMLDEDGRLLATNEAYVRRSGYSRDELLTMDIADLEADESADEVRRHVAKVRANGGDLFQTRHRTKSGERWPVEVVTAYWPSAGGRIFTFLRDITERRRAADALQESEARFRATFDQAAVGLAHVAPDGHWLRVNQKLCEILGYSADELRSLTFQDITHPEDLQTDLTNASDMLAGTLQTYSTEKRYLRRDRSVAWINLTVSLAHRPDGAPDYFIDVIEDITERKQTEAAIQALRAEMDQLTKFHVASQTAAAIAHELNQPLNALTAYTEAAVRLLHRGNPHPDKLEHALEGSMQQAQRAGRVVRELLEFMNAGEIQTERIDLNDAIKQIMARIIAGSSPRGRYRLDLQPDLGHVRANRLQVEKVLTNLIDNGIEAMLETGIDPQLITVGVCTAADGGFAQVTVTDSGPGIDRETLHRIFEPFFTTKAKGLGMGLAISRSIIEAHGGSLWAESEPGSGASFHFTLPFE